MLTQHLLALAAQNPWHCGDPLRTGRSITSEWIDSKLSMSSRMY
jgi:hypothetical protein